MEMIYYTLAALVLYGVSDYILNSIEIKLEKRLPNRSLVFFVIIAVLALSSFTVIRMVYEQPKQTETIDTSLTEPAPSLKAPESATVPLKLPAETPPENLSPSEESPSTQIIQE